MKRLILMLLMSINMTILYGDENPFGKIINEIQFEGLVNVSQNDVEGLVKSYRGKVLTEEIVYEIQETLLLSGFFLTIGDIYVKEMNMGPSAVILTVAIDKEKPIIGDIKFTGAKKFKNNDLLSKAQIRKGRAFDLGLLSIAQNNIKNAYLVLGYLQVTVSASHVEALDGTINISFQIKEGLPEVVKEIKFEGIEKLISGKGNESKEKQLRKVSISQKTRGVARKGLYKEELIAEDSQRIELFYRNHGFIDAKVVRVYPERFVNEEDGINYVTLIYVIEEGDQWLYGGVTIEGNNVYDDSELYPYFNIDVITGQNIVNRSGLNIGSIFNYSTFMDAFINGLQALYSSQGYIFNSYDPTERRQDGFIYYDIVIKEFDRAHINTITLSGNKKTKNHIIEREIPFIEGEVYSQAKMVRAYNNLMATGYFDSVIPSIERTEDGAIPGLVDINVVVEEGRTIQLQFGVTVSGTADGSFPVSGVLSFGDTNFLGYGYDFKANLSANTDEQQVGLNFYNPRFLGSRFGFGLNVNYRHSTRLAAQDILFPIFDGEDIPDPFTGQYVYTKGDQAGSYFNGTPSVDEIKEYSLVKDYQYFQFDNKYGFRYNSHEFSLGLSSGYVLAMPDVLPGYLRFNLGFNIGWEYIKYDSMVNRPAYEQVRRGLNKWIFNDGLTAKVAWDARNNPNSPTKGFILSQEYYLSGGILGGNRTYLSSKTRFDYYLALPAIKFSDKENGWKMEWGVKVHTAFTSVTNQFNKVMVDAINYYPQLDGMFFGRGWNDLQPSGQYFWENSVEFRLPIVSKILWWDTFADMHMLWKDKAELYDTSEWKSHFYGAFGTGFRIAIPSLPISVYLIKRYRINKDGSVNWMPGYAPTFARAGLDLAITFSVDMY